MTDDNEAVVEFVMDEAYHREFHDEWVASLGRGWRIDLVMIRLCGLFALILIVVAFASDTPHALYYAGLVAAIALFESWKRWRRRKKWLKFCQTLPWYGKTLRIVVRNGELSQEKDYAGDPRLQRGSRIVHTPNGYLVPYTATVPIEVPNKAISATSAHVYIPHRKITPPMTRSEFVRLITALQAE